MTILWLLFLFQAAYARKITREENLKLKERCSKFAVQADKFKRLPVRQEDYPFAVALSGIEDDKKSHTEPFCSGVLISSRHILTAAHCLTYDDDVKDACERISQGQLHLQVIAAQDLGVFQSSCSTAECWKKKEVHNVALVHMHRNYDDAGEACKNSTTYDIGIIELKHDVDFTPICMPQRNDIIPQKLKSIGYGKYGKDYSIQAVVYDSVKEDPENKDSLVAYTKHMDESKISGDSHYFKN